MDPAIELTNLTFAYADGNPALRDINLSIQPGERVAILGPNGAGKSTLLLHLNGILFGSGTVRISGIPVQKKNLGRIRAMVGLVFQSPDDQLFSPTVFDDVAYGPLYQGQSAAEIESRVNTALAAVNLQSYRNRIPHLLSLGEKKRAAVASILSMQPEILAFDEPTSGLDPRSRRSLIDLVITFSQTLIIATHDLDLARTLLPRSIVLDEGRVVADGATASLLSDTAFLTAHGLA